MDEKQREARETAARIEWPIEALLQGLFEDRPRAEPEATRRRNFERAWKMF